MNFFDTDGEINSFMFSCISSSNIGIGITNMERPEGIWWYTKVYTLISFTVTSIV